MLFERLSGKLGKISSQGTMFGDDKHKEQM